MKKHKALIIANWKCNPVSKKETERLFGMIQKEIKNIKNSEVIICPPFVWLCLLKNINKNNIILGAQDCHWENRGTYTGAISPLMLKDLGCEYVILGHSERRNYFNETDELINKKLQAALKNNLKPILCVGESEREDNEMGAVVEEQLTKCLDKIPKTRIRDIIFAYEPVWAISAGTVASGNPCLPDDAVKANLFIRKMLSKFYGRSIADKVSIIYGGSVNSKNISDYLEEGIINGALIGGASLIASDFVKIVNSVEKFDNK